MSSLLQEAIKTERGKVKAESFSQCPILCFNLFIVSFSFKYSLSKICLVLLLATRSAQNCSTARGELSACRLRGGSAASDLLLQNSRFVPLASLVPQIPPCSTTFICTTTTKIVVVIGVSSLTTHSQHKLTFYLYYIHRRWSVKFFCLSVVFHMFEVSKLLIYCSAFNHTSCA